MMSKKITHDGTSKVRLLAVGISLEFKIIEWRNSFAISKSTISQLLLGAAGKAEIKI